MTFLKFFSASLLSLVFPICAVAGEFPRADLDASNVVWNSPSENSRGSMPIGNGDIAANVWVEPSGDLLFYVSKSDAWDESMRLVKVGGVRVKFEPALIKEGKSFTQTLDLATGKILIKTPEQEVSLWVDANHPVVQVEGRSLSGQALSVTASSMLWREGQKIDPGYDNFPAFPKIAQPDTILPAENGQIGWYHANNSSPWLKNLELQGLAKGERGKDPLRNRIFGAIIRGDGFAATSDSELRTKSPVNSYSLSVHVRTEADSEPAAWLNTLKKQAAASEKIALANRQKAHEAWWDSFWNRSWIFLKSSESAIPNTDQPWRLGKDSNGRSGFAGTIVDARIEGRARPPEEIAAMAKVARKDSADLQGEDLDFSAGLTLSAWIKPGANERGRIFDKVRAGAADGILLDAHPGLSLRLIVGNQILTVQQCLVADEWQHVAATADPKTGWLRIYRNGILLEETQNASAAARVTQAYNLQRFINACAGRGAFPIKFNGSLFTADHGENDADYRRWGGCYWFMNTRLIYWSMPMAGDLDMMLPLFHMYRDLLPLRKKATQTYFKHGGAFFPETMTIWGTYNDLNYGVNRGNSPDGFVENPHIRYYWQSGIELIALMLDYYDHTEDEEFLTDILTPLAKEILTFFNEHWQHGDDGKILFSPAQSLECHFSATNPTPEVAGLHSVIPRLLALKTDPSLQSEWREMLKNLPAVPVEINGDGTQVFLPGAEFSGKRQSEVPELYPIFPYRLSTVTAGHEALEIGRNTWKTSSKKNNGWGQTPIMAAMLGLPEEAKSYVIGRVQKPAAGFRFPAFWGPNDDWMPDQDQVTIMMTALQRMLMQSNGKEIHLLPAWPKDWDAKFKLQAPGNTTIEGTISDGKIQKLSVSPESRRQDIILFSE